MTNIHKLLGDSADRKFRRAGTSSKEDEEQREHHAALRDRVHYLEHFVGNSAEVRTSWEQSCIEQAKTSKEVRDILECHVA